MLYLKACPRCHGDVNLAVDMYGKYLECLQCGLTIDSRESAEKAVAGAKTEAA